VKVLDRLVTPFLIVLVASAVACDVSGLPPSVITLRDAPDFYKTVRGEYISSIEEPVNEEIDNIVNSFDPIYRRYVRRLFMGFVAELDGHLQEAKAHYEACKSIEVFEEPSYYTEIDLARIALKESDFELAEQHLSEYIWYLSEEIKAGKGELSETCFGSVPSEEMVIELEKQKKRLEIVREDLRQFLHKK
jgi:hypothetical protein